MLLGRRKKPAEPDPIEEYRKRMAAMRARLRKAGVPEPLLADAALAAGPVRKERALFEGRAEHLFNIETHLKRILSKEETFDTLLQRAARLRALTREAERAALDLEAWTAALSAPAGELESGVARRVREVRGTDLPLWEGYHRLASYARAVQARCDRAAQMAEARAAVKRPKFAPSIRA